MKPVLTFVVPSYRTAPFINSCLVPFLDSQLRGKIRVLLIDDGSPDQETPTLLADYSTRHPDIFTYIRKDNGGHGSVINFGVGLVETPYFMVVDGDDTIDPEGAKILVDFLSQNDFDLVVTNYLEINNKTHKQRIVRGIVDEQFSGGSFSSTIANISDFRVYIHTTVWKTSIWKENHFQVREGVYYEDREYCLLPLVCVNTIGYVNRVVYKYFLGIDGQSVSPKSLSMHSHDHFIVMNDLLDYSFSLRSTKPALADYIAGATVCLISNQLVSAMFSKGCSRQMQIQKRAYLSTISKRINKDEHFRIYYPHYPLINAARFTHFHCLKLFWFIHRRLSYFHSLFSR